MRSTDRTKIKRLKVPAFFKHSRCAISADSNAIEPDGFEITAVRKGNAFKGNRPLTIKRFKATSKQLRSLNFTFIASAFSTVRRPQNYIFIGIFRPFEGSQAIPNEFLVRSRSRSIIARIDSVAIALDVLFGAIRTHGIICTRSSLGPILLRRSWRGLIRVSIIRGSSRRVIRSTRILLTGRNLDIAAPPLQAKSDCLNGALLEQECGGNNELNSYACTLAEGFHSTGPYSRGASVIHNR